MRIAFVYGVMEDTNAHGKLDRRVMAALAADHEVTVFSAAFDNPDPERIRFVRLPAPVRPLLLHFLVFHVVGLAAVTWRRLRGRGFDVIHFHDVDLLVGDVAYVHFCNRAFLDGGGIGPVRSVRQVVRWVDHQLRALLEPTVFRRAERIVVPTQGLADELSDRWGSDLADKTTVIPNFVPVEDFAATEPPDRSARTELGIPDSAFVCVFVALGHYERKGLGELLRAVAALDCSDVHLLVVGGSDSAMAPFREEAGRLGLADRLHNVETASDVRPYLWASDVFTLPSRYETFSLVAYEAAAAGLPLVATPVHGIVDILDDGVTGWQVEHDAGSIQTALARCLADPDRLERLGRAATVRVRGFGPERFDERWRAFYAT
ncbi:MAG: glycosyltransferase family 4 protein [Actinomycetota bacterium]